MKIDDLPEDEFISLYDADGKLLECRILGRTIYEEEEYAVCQSVSGEYEYLVIDVRMMEGQQIPISEMTVEEVINKFFGEHPDLKGAAQSITLTDEEGNDIRMAVLDLIEERGKRYVVCMEEDDEESEEVIILEVRMMEGREDMEEYLSVDNETLLMHLFDVFKTRNAENFDFGQRLNGRPS